MSLLEKANIINNKVYNKKTKKSIHLPARIDIFLLIALLILVITPIIIKFSFNKKNEVPPEIITLSLSPQFRDLLGGDLTEKLMLEYTEKNPEIKLIFYDNDITGAQGDSMPDILLFAEKSINAFVKDNKLLELSFFAENDSVSGSVQAIPLASFIDLLFYNIEILTAAGFNSPPRTRDDFTAYARRISGSDLNVSAAALSLNSTEELSRDIFSWIWAGGGNFWINGKNPSLNTSAIVNDIAFFDLLNREKLLAPVVFGTTGGQRVNEFANGKIAMMVASSRDIPYLKEKMRDGAFGITTIPEASTGERYSSFISSIYAAISVNCENVNEAGNFLKFLVEKSSGICAELKAVPGIVSNLIPGDYIRDDPLYSKVWEIFEYSQIAEGFSGKPNVEKYESIFLEELKIFFESSRTAQQTVNAIQRRWDEVEE